MKFKKGMIPWNKGIADIKLKCYGCKKDFIKRKSLIKDSKNIYCSPACYHKNYVSWNKIIFSKEQIKKIKELYLNMNPLGVIGRQFNCSGWSIKKVLKQEKVRIRNSTECQRLNLDTKLILDLYTNKLYSAEKIGNIIGCGPTPIFKRLRENNVPITKSKFNSGMNPWNKGLQMPYPSWNKGLSKHNDSRIKGFSDRMKSNNPMKNKETLEKMRTTKLQQYKNGLSVWNKGLSSEKDPRVRKNIQSLLEYSKHCWKDENHIKKMIEARKLKPNKEELLLNQILQEKYPNEYKYVGDFKFWIEGKNPDFINVNGQKKIIELFGNFWHNLPKQIKRDKKGLEIYKKYGYDTLIIWSKELQKQNRNNLLQRIGDFHEK